MKSSINLFPSVRSSVLLCSLNLPKTFYWVRIHILIGTSSTCQFKQWSSTIIPLLKWCSCTKCVIPCLAVMHLQKEHRSKQPEVILLFTCSKIEYLCTGFPGARISTGEDTFYQIFAMFSDIPFCKVSYLIVLLRLENPMPTHVIKTFSPPLCSSSGDFISILNMIWKKLLRCRRNSILRERKQKNLRNKTKSTTAVPTSVNSNDKHSEHNKHEKIAQYRETSLQAPKFFLTCTAASDPYWKHDVLRISRERWNAWSQQDKMLWKENKGRKNSCSQARSLSHDADFPLGS